MIKKLICLIFLGILISCSSSNNINNNDNNKVLIEPENLYKIAIISFDNENIDLARDQFLEIMKLFPLSNEAIQSEIMIAFIDYVKMDYEKSILNYGGYY